MKQGTVVRVAFGKNFAFINDGLQKDDYFFHRDNFAGFWKDMESDFANGKEIRVQFDLGQPKDKSKGPRATNVSRLDYPNQSVTPDEAQVIHQNNIE